MATVKQTKRRESALRLLEAQLESGVKPLKTLDEKRNKFVTSRTEKVPLEEKDRVRIQKNIEILRNKIK